MPELVEKLKELTALKESGALSEEEFQAAKAKLLSPEVQPVAEAVIVAGSSTSFIELSFNPVGTWKCSDMFLGGDGCVSLDSSTLVITRSGADTLTVETKDASVSDCCKCGRPLHLMFESSSTFTIRPMTGTFEGMLWGGPAAFNANFKFINENEIQTKFPLKKKSLTFTRQSQDGSLMPIARVTAVMNRD